MMNARDALGSVSLVASDQAWPNYFKRERTRLSPILGEVAEHLEHYGSSAVPGLDAKPIIDMMGPISTLAQADMLAPALARFGYQRIDAGFTQRRFFRREPEDISPAYHLHIVICSSWPLKNELLLRDWLIAHPPDARAYAELKALLAAAFPDDMPSYTAGKTKFLRDATNRARISRGLPLEDNWIE